MLKFIIAIVYNLIMISNDNIEFRPNTTTSAKRVNGDRLANERALLWGLKMANLSYYIKQIAL